MVNPHLKELLRSILETDEFEINCEECYELLDRYAERLLEGEDPNMIMPTVKQHLRHCVCCDHELEALIIMLREISA